jgi:hypothetical protein
MTITMTWAQTGCASLRYTDWPVSSLSAEHYTHMPRSAVQTCRRLYPLSLRKSICFQNPRLQMASLSGLWWWLGSARLTTCTSAPSPLDFELYTGLGDRIYFVGISSSYGRIGNVFVVLGGTAIRPGQGPPVARQVIMVTMPAAQAVVLGILRSRGLDFPRYLSELRPTLIVNQALNTSIPLYPPQTAHSRTSVFTLALEPRWHAQEEA